ncbi:deoxyribose-phosphate aldolase [Paenibacillus sacheonensis]|uniref:Deoxyribose-phosphate aldolase n=1 Tax=Paenibacillus sacheonensis TaxID=742054 RepID=A0A7X4YLC8_9BACL|nr:deoxyribose-phosphate aldolase [Paenibacillus sacheonensis]MBM7568331.1 deoxyribose-phosphate aldolase [Paenibacillus sacheonensis]NBC68486.1 deoxyribose-phosphate aldolase [Paenibacillus sacheonensis]
MDKELAGAALAAYFDHTALKPETAFADIVKLCSEAKEHGFATVCVNPYWVGEAKEQLNGTGVGITTVIGFPLGANSTFVKVAETRDAIASGATEIDMVLNVGALKSGRLEVVEKDVRAVAEACQGSALLKVILEVGLLTDAEKVTASEICKRAGADYVKTSTGFGPGGATVKDIALMRKTVGPDMGVKASGGVRDLETARALIAAGATRIGASAGVAIVSGGKGEGY